MSRETQRAEANAGISCAECGTSVKAKNLEAHYRQQHPGVDVPSMRAELDAALADRETSRQNVADPPERGSSPDGAGAQATEQEPIPNPADRRPSTLDTTVGY